MSKSNSNAELYNQPSTVEATYSANQHGPVCVVDGAGLSIRVERNHLVVSDGIGRNRRERRYHKATHGLSRIVVLGASGTVSLDALRYCDRLGIELAVIDPISSAVTFTSTPKGIDDARLRRIQALVPESALGLDIIKMLLAAKLDGQSKVLRTKLGRSEEALSVASLRDQLAESTSYDEIRGFEASAAACYFNAWAASKLVVARYVAKDRGRVPEHWRHFDGRRSVLHANNGNRKAERPVNAILNYLFALLEVEAILACHAIGLDPGLGILHQDAKSRQSMALDLMEPVRPLVEAWTLDLLNQRSFRRSDFVEKDDGHVRLIAPLTHDLAGSIGQWKKAVAPWAEKVAHLLGEAMKGKYQPSTPLTGRRAIEARREVKSLKEAPAIYREVFPRGPVAPKQSPRKGRGVDLRNCETCGGPLARGQHVRCPACWEGTAGQDIQTRRKRGAAISESKRASRKWKEEHPLEVRDVEWYRESILPTLKSVPLSTIMRACGVAKSTASRIRSGKSIAAERHWAVLSAVRGTKESQSTFDINTVGTD
jgi:CRISPR-associated endonuclease Cas1